MNLQPAYTLSPGQPSAYLCPKSEERTFLTPRAATFSLAISGRLSDNHFSCFFTRETTLSYCFFKDVSHNHELSNYAFGARYDRSIRYLDYQQFLSRPSVL